MDVNIFIRGVEHATGLRSFAEEKLALATERFQDRILNATMRLEDVTGPEKHGVDKQCCIELKMRTGDVRIKELGEDFHATIEHAIDRMRASLSRETAKAKRGIGEG